MGGLTLDDFTKSRAYREIYREGEAAGEARGKARVKALGEATVTLRLLNRRCGPLECCHHSPDRHPAAGATGVLG